MTRQWLRCTLNICEYAQCMSRPKPISSSESTNVVRLMDNALCIRSLLCGCYMISTHIHVQRYDCRQTNKQKSQEKTADLGSLQFFKPRKMYDWYWPSLQRYWIIDKIYYFRVLRPFTFMFLFSCSLNFLPARFDLCSLFLAFDILIRLQISFYRYYFDNKKTRIFVTEKLSVWSLRFFLFVRYKYISRRSYSCI